MSPKATKDNPLGLEPFEGQAVSELAINITGHNASINNSLQADVVLIEALKNVQHGDTVYVVLELTKVGAAMGAATKHDGWKRTDRFLATGGAVIDADQAVDVIAEQRDRVEEAIAAASGQSRLPGVSGTGNATETKDDGKDASVTPIKATAPKATAPKDGEKETTGS